MKKKTLLITIIVLIILLILAGGILAYLYLSTDLFKSDKELFAKYLSLTLDEEKGFVPSIFKEYMNKIETTAYESSGSFSVNNDLLVDTTNNENYQMIRSVVDTSNNTNITFTGRVDKANRKIEEDFFINYSDTVNLPFKYKREGDIYAIQADMFSPTYIAIENNNLPQLLQKLGVTDVTGIPNKIEIQAVQSLQFTENEIKHLINNYIIPVYNNLAEEKFTQSEGTNGETDYSLNLTNEELRNIFVQFLQIFSNDTIMLTKLNNIVNEIYEGETQTITSEDIQSLIGSINAKTVEDGKIAQTNTEQMNQINFPTEMVNPMYFWFAIPSLSMSMYNITSESIGSSNLNEEEIEASNQRFEIYKGDIRGSQARALCDLVNNHNIASAGNHLINIKLGEEASLTTMTSNINGIYQIKNSISPGKTYNVTMTYDINTGYICEIGIVEN